MKGKIICLFALIMVGVIACQKGEEKVDIAAEEKNELEGVWELVSTQYTTSDTTFYRTQADWVSIKIITGSHFATVGHKPDRSKFSEDATDEDVVQAFETFSANGGTYSLEGDTYTEHLRFFLNPNLENSSAPIKYQLEGDKLILNIEINNGVWKETYRRLE